MAEYIEREKALIICEKEYQERLKMQDWCGDTVAWNIGNAIKSITAADVAPVVHGRWINVPPYHGAYGQHLKAQECSVCHAFYVSDANKPYSNHKYCAECGARMDGE